MAIPRDDLIRLSAIIIARGSLGLYSRVVGDRTVGSVTLTFQHRDPDFLNWIGRTIGRTHISLGRPRNRRVFRFVISGGRAARLLLSVLPYSTHNEQLYRLLIDMQQASINHEAERLQILYALAREALHHSLEDQLVTFHRLKSAG